MKAYKVIAAIGLDSASGREIFSGVCSYIEEGHPWQIRLIQTSEELTADVIRSARSVGVGGFMFTFLNDTNVIRAVEESELPVAILGTKTDALDRRKAPTAKVWNDNAALGVAAANHLLELGVFKSYLFIHSCRNGPLHSFERARGYAETLRKSGRRLDGAYETPCDEGSPDDFRRLAEWLDGFPRPIAALAASDRRALHVLAAAERVGISVPQQLSLVGVDNDVLRAAHSSPPLTSVQPGHFEMGFTAAAQLQRLMTSRSRKGTRPVWIGPTRVVSRESTGFVTPSVTIVDRAKRYILEHATGGATVADVVSYLGCSRSLADLRLRQAEGKTVRVALEEARLNEVCRLLRTTTRSVTKIASQCGFKSNHMLTHLFTRRYGVPPGAWRKKAKSSR